jgi:hypothetical protein
VWGRGRRVGGRGEGGGFFSTKEILPGAQNPFFFFQKLENKTFRINFVFDKFNFFRVRDLG